MIDMPSLPHVFALGSSPQSLMGMLPLAAMLLIFYFLILMPMRKRQKKVDEFRAAISERCLPALEAHRPEILFVSAGFDAHREDPLANLKLADADFAWVTSEIVAVAARHAQGRIVSSLEGGYALSALGRSAIAHMRGLAAV